jgi:predicted permease
MILVALTVVMATAAGVVCDHRATWAPRLARGLLTVMLFALIPFISYVSFAHLRISLGGGIGILAAYVGIGLGGMLAWRLGRRADLARPVLGGVIIAVIVVNTGYLGLPMTVAILGHSELNHAVVYDQIVNGPIVFTAGFAVGAAFGHGEQVQIKQRIVNFLTRNPPLVGAVAGLIVPASLAPPALTTARNVLVDALLVLGFLVVGIYLSSERREDHARLLERPDLPVGIALVCRFCVASALLGALSLAGVGIPSAYLLQSVMPSGVNGLIVGHAFGLDQRMIATTIVWSTLVVLIVGSVVYLA